MLTPIYGSWLFTLLRFHVCTHDTFLKHLCLSYMYMFELRVSECVCVPYIRTIQLLLIVPQSHPVSSMKYRKKRPIIL